MRFDGDHGWSRVPKDVERRLAGKDPAVIAHDPTTGTWYLFCRTCRVRLLPLPTVTLERSARGLVFGNSQQPLPDGRSVDADGVEFVYPVPAAAGVTYETIRDCLASEQQHLLFNSGFCFDCDAADRLCVCAVVTFPS